MTPLVTVIQARMSSSRLPGKVLLPLGGATVLDQVIRRARGFSTQVVVCTSIDVSDDPIVAHCTDAGVLCVRGSLDDVFTRYVDTLRHPQVERTEWFARVTADCPLLSEALGRALVDACGADLDYLAYESSQLPVGLSVELVRRETFLAIEADGLDAPEREHVTLHLYEEPGRFNVKRLSVPEDMRHPTLRLTVDYSEDYDLLLQLFEGSDEVTAERAVSQLLADADLRRINAGCAQRAARPASA